MKVAIMQPYFFPYIGYFQLINSVDKFIFYDDVTFIKQGWINRNRILLNNKDHLITLKLKGASSNKLINEIEIIHNNGNLLKTIYQAYKKAPYFREISPIIEEVFRTMESKTKISEISEISVKRVSKYLGLNTEFETSSELYFNTRFLTKENRLIEICKENKADIYINPYGGESLYDKSNFKEKEIKLFFIKNNIVSYNQFKSEFVPALSIIDVLMFNHPEIIKEMLRQYVLF